MPCNLITWTKMLVIKTIWFILIKLYLLISYTVCYLPFTPGTSPPLWGVVEIGISSSLILQSFWEGYTFTLGRPSVKSPLPDGMKILGSPALLLPKFWVGIIHLSYLPNLALAIVLPFCNLLQVGC